MRVAVLLGLAAGASAFSAPSSRPTSVVQRSSSPLMQFSFGGGGGAASKTGRLPPGWKKVKSESRPGEFSYLNTKTGKRYDRLPNAVAGDFFDDEKDTTNNRFAAWSFKDDEELSMAERSGFSESGRDLATDGLMLYALFIPFLVAIIGFWSGAFNFGYGKGNF